MSERIAAIEISRHPWASLRAPDGNDGLGDACRAKAREGLWLLYRELLTGERDAAREILDIIDPEPDRLRSIEGA